MARVLVSAATGATNAVLMKLDDLLRRECTMFTGMRGDIMFLKAELEYMHAFLEKVSCVENPTQQDKLWMRDVRDLSYDIEDRIDLSFIVHVNDESIEPKRFWGFIIERSMSLLTQVKTHYLIAKEIHGLKERIKEVSERHGRYTCDGYAISRCSNMSIDPRVCGLHKNMLKLVGIDRPKEELIRLLMEGDNRPSQDLKIVSIVGIGGLGKTTVDKQVYESLGRQFEYQAFVSLSQNPDIIRILTSLRDQLLRGDSTRDPKRIKVVGQATDCEYLISYISNFLKERRYFVVIDDVWTVQTWNIIKCVFPKNDFGNRVVTTTRINEVAEVCCSSYGDLVYKLKPLCPMDSKRLFMNRLFGPEEHCPRHLSKIADKILKKCAGLPLAIIAVSGLLASKDQTLCQWDRVQNSIGSGLERNLEVQGMISVLSLSYIDLPYFMKSCLLYLTIFPEDYNIEKKRLIRRWIAEGFVHKEHGHTLYELGERIFNELMNRSLIQPGEISIFGEMKTCQVHDMILDFLVSKAVEENFTTIIGVHNVAHEPEKKVRRLSLQDKSADDAIREEDSSQHIVLENKNIYHPFLPLRLINRPIPDLKIPEDLIVSHVRSLTLFGTVRDLHPFQRCRLLRVLDLHSCIILSRDYLIDFGYLIFLKYFSIKGTVVDVIPNNISELQNLETLNITNVKGCYKIPATMVQLGRLVTLHVERELPDGIGGMKALQVLKKVNVFKQTTNFVQEIGQLTNLRSLHITVATVFSRYAENKEENMKMMVSAICNLGRYDLHSIRIDITDELDIEFFQESWWHSPPISLHKLVVKLAKISRVPRWMGSLVNLQKLFFPMKEVRQADLVILGGLPALLSLFLPVEGRVSAGPAGGRVRISGSHGFPSLRLFQIGGDVCALGLVFDVGCMPKLQRLEFEFNAWETNHLTIGCFSFGIEQLSSLTSAFCRIVYVGATNDTFQQVEAALEEARSTHPNNPRFTRCSHPTRSQMIKKARKEEKRQVHELTESEEEEYEGSDYKKYLKLIKFQYNG